MNLPDRLGIMEQTQNKIDKLVSELESIEDEDELELAVQRLQNVIKMRAKSRASTIKKSNPSVPAEKDLPVKEGSTLEAPSQCCKCKQ